ncbi:MAG: hypothetical protein ACYDAD_04860 [Acidimicrobiales bacterium]
MMGLCFTVGLSNVINRFHATLLADLDDATVSELGGTCPLPLPGLPEVPRGAGAD